VAGEAISAFSKIRVKKNSLLLFNNLLTLFLLHSQSVTYMRLLHTNARFYFY